MRTQIFIENNEADISEDLSTLLTFELDNVKDFSSRSTSWSKTVVLPGTARNNKLFGHIFQIGQSNVFNENLDNIGYNFNASKAADCLIFQDQVQTFKGVLRLMQINLVKGRIEYEAAVFGELAGLNVSLSGGLLEDLDFSAYDHIYNETNIVNSWDNVSGVGYYYPLIDHGTYSITKDDWDIRTFRPALYAKEYIDKMFAAANYRYSCDLFNTARFKGLIIPYNRKTLTTISGVSLSVSYSGVGQQYTDPSTGQLVTFPTQTVLGDFTTGDDANFTYGGTATLSGTIVVNLQGTIDYNYVANNVRIDVNVNGGSVYFKNYFFDEILSPESFNITLELPVAINAGDVIHVILTSADTGQFYNLTITAATLIFNTDSTTPVTVAPGDTVKMNDTIPKNIRQIDFLVSIVKLFNLYVYESMFDSRLIYITPYVDFYSTDSADSVDWTYKLNRDKPIKVRPMSELTSKKYDFKYKPDSDYYNDLYRKRYGQGYGDYTFDSQFEFAQQSNSLELIFSATVLVGYLGQDKIYSTIFKQSNNNEETIDYNIRILQAKKITGVTSWDIKDGASVLVSLTKYGYAGHFNDPDAPSDDLNFGVLRELFFTLATGNLTVTQFNVYWSAYMAEITDKDSKLVSAFFKLTALDILNLDFKKKIFIDGNLFRLNSIKDYNMSTPTDCEVELLKVNYLIY